MLLMPGPEVEDDWDLINRRDREAMDLLFRRHRDFVYRMIWARTGQRELAEDLTHDIFLKLSRPRRRLFRGARFRTWLYRVASNALRDHQRRARFETPLEDWQLPLHPDHSGSADSAVLMAALARLPDRQRQVVLLRILEQFDTQETATALGIGAGSVKTHLHRALGNLRAQLETTSGE